MAILKRGLAGEPVKIVQQKLGVPTNREFGSGTEAALKKYQQENGLAADGIAGPDTFVRMGLYELILLKVGTSGESVKKLQQALGVTADGQFGSGTEKAVKEFQQKNGLAADGIAGPATLAKMNIFKEITPAVVQKSQMPAGSATPAGTSSATSSAPPAGTTGPSSATSSAPRSIWDSIKSIFKS
jgi:peptidoglycan hydrolase-like protein with peptidoglycan-binding domain